MERGVLYIATDEDLAREADMSAMSLDETNPDISTSIITDQNEEFQYIDNVINKEEGYKGFANKPKFIDESPYDKTIYLDTDTYVIGDINDLFDVLEYHDIAAAHNHARTAYTLGNIPASFPEYNTGVICFKQNQQVKDLFNRWVTEYDNDMTEDNPPDQPSFRKSLYECDVSLATLPPEYNCMVRYPGYVADEVKILHSRILDIETEGAVKFHGFSMEDAKEVINRSIEPRFHWGWRKLRIDTGPWEPMWSRLLLSLGNNGIRGTVGRIIEEIKR